MPLDLGSTVAGALASYAVKKGADWLFVGRFVGFLLHRKKLKAFERAFAHAVNTVAGQYPEVAVELFSRTSSDKLRAFVDAFTANPASSPDIDGAVSKFFAMHFPGLSGPRLNTAVSERYRRPIEDVSRALELFYSASLIAFAQDETLRQFWRDQNLRLVLDRMEEIPTATAAAIEASLDNRSKRHLGPDATDRLKKELVRLRARIGMPPFSPAKDLLGFIESIEAGPFSLADDSVRAEALNFCARLLVRGEDLSHAESIRARAVTLGSPATDIVFDAWLAKQKGDVTEAFAIARQESTPLAITVQLSLLFDPDHPEQVVKEIQDRRLCPADMTGGGVSNALQAYTVTGALQSGLAFSERIDDSHLTTTPWLHAQIGLINLLVVADEEERHALVAGTLPPNPEGIVVRTNPDWKKHLANAHSRFKESSIIASDVGATSAAQLYEELALFAALEHPELRVASQDELRRRVADSEAAARLVHLADTYEVPFDKDGIRGWIENAARLGQLRPYEVRALFVVFDQPQELLRFIVSHKSNISNAVGEPTAQLIELEARARTKDTEGAAEIFDSIRGSLPSATEKRIELLLQNRFEITAIATLRQRYEQTNEVSDLRALLAALSAEGDHERLYHFAAILFRRTGHPNDLVNVTVALQKLGRHVDAWTLLEENWQSIEKTEELWRARCRVAFATRNLREAKTAIDSVSDRTMSTEDCQLAINIAMESGAWAEMAQIIRDVSAVPNAHQPGFLIYLSQIAALLDATDEALRLSRAAVAIAPHNPEILLGAHGTALKIGREEEPEALGWFEAAVQHSDQSGPIQKKSFKELLELAPANMEKDSAISKAWLSAELPMFMVADMIGSSVVDLTLKRGIQNRIEADPRRRGLISAFFGGRGPRPISSSSTIALDLTAILNLEISGCLERTLTAGPSVTVPAWTFGALFIAIDNLRFHQPSRLRRASAIRSLLADGTIAALESLATREDLVQEVGPRTAGLIEEAERNGGTFVRPAPLHRFGSFMEVEIELDRLSSTAVDTFAAVAALEDAGAIAKHQADALKTILKDVDQGWQSERSIDLAKPIYLDALAADYLLRTEVLEQLARTARSRGAMVYVEAAFVQEANDLIANEQVVEEALARINSIRKSLADAVADERLIVAGEVERTSSELPDAPTSQAIFGALDTDFGIFDDRAINRFDTIPGAGARTIPIGTSLDLINLLKNDGRIDDEQWRVARHKLREAGILFIPIEPDELQHWLNGSKLDEEGGLKETLELRSIRESIQRVLMLTLPIFPAENLILQGWRLSLLLGARRAWSTCEDAELARARAEWCRMLLPDPRDLTHLFATPQSEGSIDQELAQNAAHLAVNYVSDADIQSTFLEWAEDFVIAPLSRERPNAFELCLDAIEALSIHGEDNGEPE